MNIQDFIITKEMSIYEAADVINKNARKTAFLLEEGVLLGVLSDGDLRRFFLSKGDMADSVKKIVNYYPKFLYEEDIVDYKSYMIENVIDALPIVNKKRELVRIEFLTSFVSRWDDIIPNDVKVVVMAGGRGSRLKPYSDILPKPLIPIGDKTILEHIIEKFSLQGVRDFSIIVNYRKSLIKSYFSELENSNNIAFVDENCFQGTAGGLKLLNDVGKTFFVTNCDILIKANYASILKYHNESHNIITLVVAEQEIAIPYGTTELNESNQVISLIEKPRKKYDIITGMYICDNSILELIQENEYLDMPTLISKCIEDGKNVGAYRVKKEAWLDMGEFEALEEMKKQIESF